MVPFLAESVPVNQKAADLTYLVSMALNQAGKPEAAQQWKDTARYHRHVVREDTQRRIEHARAAKNPRETELLGVAYLHKEEAKESIHIADKNSHEAMKILSHFQWLPPHPQ